MIIIKWFWKHCKNAWHYMLNPYGLIDSKPLSYDIMGLYSVIVSLIGLLVFIVIFLGISSSIRHLFN